MATYTIEEWARYYLTGDTASSSPTDGQFGPMILSVKSELIAGNPCIGEDPDTELTGADEEAWTEWVGAVVAGRYAGTPMGRTLVAPSAKTVVKIGPVTKESSNATGGAILTVADMLRAGQAARARIACIRAAIAEGNQNGAGLFALAGRRRAIGEVTTLEGQMLGEGADGATGERGIQP